MNKRLFSLLLAAFLAFPVAARAVESFTLTGPWNLANNTVTLPVGNDFALLHLWNPAGSTKVVKLQKALFTMSYSSVAVSARVYIHRTSASTGAAANGGAPMNVTGSLHYSAASAGQYGPSNLGSGTGHPTTHTVAAPVATYALYSSVAFGQITLFDADNADEAVLVPPGSGIVLCMVADAAVTMRLSYGFYWTEE